MANNPLSNLTPKQKIIGGIFAVIVVIIGWQVLSLMGGSSAPVAITAAPAPQAMPASGAAPNGNPAGLPPQQGAAKDTALNQSPSSAAIVTDQSSADNFSNKANEELLQLQKKGVIAYLGMVNKLQSLKLEKEIAETSSAIATANLARTMTDKKMSKLLTAPTIDDYANKLSGGSMNPQDLAKQTIPNSMSGGMAGSQPSSASSERISDYILVSISQQLEKWIAVIGFQNKLYSVSVGDKLPVDGAMITAIDSHSITLKKGTLTKKIDFITSV